MIFTSDPIIICEANSDLKSVSISLRPLAKIEAKIFPFEIRAPV
jgi:hypothetical protein